MTRSDAARSESLAEPLAETVPPGDEPDRRVRSGRRARWLDQAGCFCGGPGLYGGQVGPTVSGRFRGAESVRILPYTAMRAVLEEALRRIYLPECLEGKFSELGPDGDST